MSGISTVYSTILCLISFILGEVDFAPVPSPSELAFTSGNERQCVNITIVNDDSVEVEEEFTAVLSTDVERVTFSAGVAVVTVIDDEGNHRLS